MIVVSISSVPPSLRGDLTRWLFEIDTGVFVGRMTARVRDELWERITRQCGNGRAIMVFGNDSEQRFDFRTLNCEWEPADLDGIKIMRRPLPSEVRYHESKTGFSKISHFRRAKTSGLKGVSDEIVFASVHPSDGGQSDVSIEYAVFKANGEKIDSLVCKEPNPEEKRVFLSSMFSDATGKKIFMESSEMISRIRMEFSGCGLDSTGLMFSSIKSISKVEMPELLKHDVWSISDYFGISCEGKIADTRILSEVYFKMAGHKPHF